MTSRRWGLVALTLAVLSVPPISRADATVPVVRFLTVPPTTATAGDQVELRLSVVNESETEAVYTVDFFAGSTSSPIGGSVMISAPPGGHGLARAFWRPTDPGTHTILHRVSYQATVVSEGSWEIEVVDAARPRFGGAWIEPSNMHSDRSIAEQDIRARVDEAKEIGMDVLIIAYVESSTWNGGPYYPSRIEELGPMVSSFDVIGTILDQAESNDMHVFLGLGRGPNGALALDDPWVASREEMDAEAERGEAVAEELEGLYGHLGSLYGWYISHEANSYGSAKYFYDEQARRLRRFGPERPVMIAPAGTPTGIDPQTLNSSEVDIFAYQDAVGPGYVGPGTSCRTCIAYSYTWDPYLRIDDLHDIWPTYATWHEGTDKHIWADIELWQMDGPSYGNAYAGTCGRLRDQIAEAVGYTTFLTAYEFFGYMRAPTNDTTMPRAGAAGLYDGYQAYVSGETEELCPDEVPKRCPVPLPYIPGDVRRSVCSPLP